MKAIRIHQNGDASVLQLEDLPMPQPQAGEALIQLKAAGLNFVDIYMRQGRRSIPLPFTPGREGAGIVKAVGEGVTEVKPGDRVAYAQGLGAYAEYSVVPASRLIPLPAHISFEVGAAFPLQGMTAHYLVHDFYRIQPGDHVLVHAAAGGVGLLVVQMLKHLGAHIIGTVSTSEKAEMAKKAGAHEVILYTQQDFVAETKRLTKGQGADYIIDGVGKDTFTKDLDALRIRGTVCLFGSASGPAEPLSPNALQGKSLTVCAGMLDNFIHSRDALLKRANDVLQAIQAGWLHIKIDKIFTLAQAADAQRALEARQTSGKVILTMED